MNRVSLNTITARPPVVIAALTVLTVLTFFAVNRLVNRYSEQQKALARHLYTQGLADQRSGHPDRATQHLRAALSYDHDNFQYQLSLARALRDNNQTAEAETYLITLWESQPQDAAVNLALGRLEAREKFVDKAIQYYHNAIYGVWSNDSNSTRLDAWFELVEFLVRQNAGPQAQAELIILATEVLHDPGQELRVARLFAEIQDYEHALSEYQRVLRSDRSDAAALAGAGQAAFNLGRYGTAERYLQSAAKADPADTQTSQLLETCRLILQANPFAMRLSAAERRHRLRDAFNQAGERLNSCAQTMKPASSDLAPLQSQWLAMKPKLARFNADESDIANTAMDLVLQIEQQTEKDCGAPTGLDRALLLALAQNRAQVEQ